MTRRVDGWVFIGSGPETSWRMAGDTLTLRVRCNAVASDCEARHTVRVPRGVTVQVNDDNGGVTASGFSTPLRIESLNGDVTVRDTTGPLELASDNGSIATEGVSARALGARSENGSIRLGVKAGAAPERIEGSSDNGKVLIELPGSGRAYAVTADSTHGSVTVDVPTDKRSTHVVKARSGSGSVTIRRAD